MPSIYDSYKKLTRLPAGKFLFSKAIGFGAPFFAKIKPKVIDLRPGYCEVQIRDRRGVRNHIGTINAGALCTLAELTGGMALDSIVPKQMRWIPRSMTVNYLKKATGTITATSSIAQQIAEEGQLNVLVEVRDQASELVFTANIDFYISLKK